MRIHIIILGFYAKFLGETQVDVPELIRQSMELGKANGCYEVAGCVAWSPFCIQ